MSVATDSSPKRARISVEVDRSFHDRVQQVAAERDLTVRQYVLAAIEERLRLDTGAAPEADGLTAAADPVLAELWDNDQDAAYDRL